MARGNLTTIEAGCHDCEWESMARNAQGNAARHAKAHNHATWVTTTYEYRRHDYVPPVREYGNGIVEVELPKARRVS